MIEPHIQENYADNGAFSHYSLIDSSTGVLLWSEEPHEEINKDKRTIKIEDLCERNCKRHRLECKLREVEGTTYNTKNLIADIESEKRSIFQLIKDL